MNCTRTPLPHRRRSVSQKFRVVDRAGVATTVHFTVGLYDDGRPGELFIDMHKQGAALRDWSGQAAMLFSIMLQYGIPLAVLCEFFVGSKSEPNGRVELPPRLARCTSVMDCIARSLAIEYLGREDLADAPASAGVA
jgi:ribonucleoside-diphosphate reductase alpha chain